jgi:hypothetical protein
MWRRTTTPLAWRNFSYSRARLVGSLAGVTFAVILMFVEMGFLNGLYDNHTRFVDLLDADLLLVNADKEAVIPSSRSPAAGCCRCGASPGWPPPTACAPRRCTPSSRTTATAASTR